MSGILDLFSVDISAVDSARIVSNDNVFAGLGLTNLVVAETEVLHTFGDDRCCPVNARLVIVVYYRRGREVVGTKILGRQSTSTSLKLLLVAMISALQELRVIWS